MVSTRTRNTALRTGSAALAALMLMPGAVLAIAGGAPAPAGSAIRPRQEGRFAVSASKPMPADVRVLGTIAGRELVEFDSPARMGNMGKIMVEDPDGSIWYLETREDQTIRIDPKTLEMTVYQLPRGAGPYSHAVDSKGVHWITAHGIEMLLEFDPRKMEVISHASPSFGFLIHVNVRRQDDTVFFCQPGSNLIVSYHPEHGFREYPIPTPSAGPGRLDFDAEGNVWFPELYADKLAKLDPRTGKVQEWDLPIKGGTPSFARVDERGDVWVSLPMGDRILRFANGRFTEFTIPTRGSLVSTTVTDEGGFIWFTEGGWRGSSGGNKVGRLDPATGEVLELAVPTPNAQPLGIIIDHEGTMWFEQMNAGRICRLSRKPVAALLAEARASVK